MSGSLIHHFPFFFFGIFNTDNFSGCLRVRGGKFPCEPQCRILARQSCCRLSCFRVYSPLLYEHSLLLLFYLFLYSDRNSHFSRLQTWNLQNLHSSSLISLSRSLSHSHSLTHTLTLTITHKHTQGTLNFKLIWIFSWCKSKLIRSPFETECRNNQKGSCTHTI